MAAVRESDDQIGRAAVSKASWRLLPLIGLGYGIAYMDRVNIRRADLARARSARLVAAAVRP